MEAPKKEIIIAVILGLITGVLFSFTIWMIKKQPLRKNATTKTTVKKTPTPTLKEDKKPIFLTINSPSTESKITTEGKFVLKGETLKNTRVIISTEKEDFLITSDENGKFSQEIKLEKPINQIYLTAIDNENNTKTHLITLYYEKEE